MSHKGRTVYSEKKSGKRISPEWQPPGREYPSPILCAETETDCQTAALVAQAGYDPAFGARPLRRAIRDHIENPLAKALLAGRFTEGDTIRAAVKNGRLVFS